MKRNNKGIQPNNLFLGSMIAGALFAMPTYAFAEESAGVEILIPHMVEFVPALIAFVLILILFAKFFWPKVLANLDARQEKIAGDLEAAAQDRVDARKELDAYKERIANAEAEADEIIAEAKRNAEDEAARIKAQAQTEAQEIIQRAHEAVANERKSAELEIANQIADLSVGIAEKIIEENLNEEKQLDLVDKYLQKVGNLNAK